LLRKALKDKREPLLRGQHGHPHNTISQSAVVTSEPFIEISYDARVCVPNAVLLKRNWVENKHGSVAVVEAFRQ
jgi:hypothetical protein